MTLSDQIEARTNAANTSAVWKHLKRSERETQKTDSERLLSAASHVSDEKRKGWLLLVTVMIEIAKWPQTKWPKTRLNCMYSISAARAHGTRVQSPKREDILR